MKRILTTITILFSALSLWLWWQRLRSSAEIRAIDVTIELSPMKIMLPDELGESEGRAESGRSGETQELERELVPGSFRPIRGRGAPSQVQRRQL